MRNKVLLPLFYLPPIHWFVCFTDPNYEVEFEKWENFPKQTFRNRTEIYAANGKLKLTIPVQHTESKVYSEIKISYAESWQRIHWRSIKSAYKNAPYFEFYEEDFQEIYEEKPEKLWEFNLTILNKILKFLRVDKSYSFSQTYENTFPDLDLRNFFSAKNNSGMFFEEYYQVFCEKHGFISNLSILDLLFHLGPQSLNYLNQSRKKISLLL